MGAYLAVALVAFLFVLQKIWPKKTMENLLYYHSLNRKLVEPEEQVILNGRLYNQWWLPIMYMSLTVFFPKEAEFLEKEAWKKQNLRNEIAEKHVVQRFYLMPHHRGKFQIHFSLPRRGRYHLGNHFLETGDLFGIQTNIKREEQRLELIVMPRSSQDPVVIKMLGGFMGEISARRFIYEDPILTVGFREYTGREPMKSISWKQTARSGELVVHQYDHTVDINVAVLLNTEGGSKEELESCFEITRRVCEELEKKHIVYEFFTNGDLKTPVGTMRWLPEGLGRTHFQTIMYGLGSSNCHNLGSFMDMVEQCKGRRKSGRSYLVITPPLKKSGVRAVNELERISELEVCVLVGKAENEEVMSS